MQFMTAKKLHLKLWWNNKNLWKMKRLILTFGFVFSVLLGMAQTPQAIWTEGNRTITFYYGSLYNVGDNFGGQTVTKVWSGSRFHEIKRTDDPTIIEREPGWVTDQTLINQSDRSFVCSDFPEKIETAVFDPSVKIIDSLIRGISFLAVRI